MVRILKFCDVQQEDCCHILGGFDIFALVFMSDRAVHTPQNFAQSETVIFVEFFWKC